MTGPVSRVAVAVIGLLLTVTAGASAQEPGVFVDPDSAAAKEYAIPLDEARRTSSGSPPPAAPSATNAPSATGQPAKSAALFGEGVKPRKPAGSSSPSQPAPAADPSSAPAGSPRDASVGSRPPTVGATRTVQPSVTAWTLFVALGVLALGGGIALVSRRRGAQP